MIWNFCIRRPVLTIVIFLVIGIFGFYGYQQMAVREWPDVEFPVVNVNVVLAGAEPEVIETEVIEPLEEEINTIEGLKELRSTAREEVGTVTAEFELWRDIDIAAQDIRDRVNRAQRELPDDIEAPVVRKLDPDAQAILWIALQGDERWDTIELTEYADNQIKPRLESLRGVGRVQIGGERKYAVRIKLNHEKLTAHRLTVRDVVRTIQANNVDIPSGRVEGKQREFLVKVQGQFAGPEPFNDLIVAQRNGSPVRLGDVGRAVRGVENDRTEARFDGEPTVGLGIVKQSDANMVALAHEVKRRIEEISDDFAPGLRYSIATDDSTYVEENINDLQTTIIIATVLVVLVILLFLRTIWGTLITSIAIPTSLMAGFAMIYVFNFSLNVLSMLAFILVIGIVVDDAIVVLESCYRHMEKGAERLAAARVGTTEIAFAAIANTLSLGAVFIPVAFTRGLIGRFFFEFGVTVAVTVFASTFTARTLTPMLCSRILSVPDRESGVSGWAESMFSRLESAYSTALDWSLDHRLIVVVVALLTFVAGLVFFQLLSKEFSPAVDKGDFVVSFEMPEGATLQETNDYSRRIEEVLRATPEVKHYFLAIGLAQGGPGKVSEGISFVHMVHRTKRERGHLQVMQDVRERLAKIPSGRAFVLEPAGVGPQQAPIQLVLKHDDIDRLAEQQSQLMGWMRNNPEFVGVNTNLKLNKPQVNVHINRDKASQMGITVTDIASTLRYILGEPDISEVERGSERYEVIPEMFTKARTVPSVINELYVRGESGQLVSLSNLVTLREVAGPSELHHFNRRRSAIVSTSTPPDVIMGDAIDKIRERIRGTLPSGFGWEVAGQAQDMQESFWYLTVSLIFAIVFVYLVLAAQFESWLHPFTIMLTLPLAASGAYGVLYGLGMTFSIFTFIGTIMLIGLVTKNGILLIDYTNVLVARGKGIREAAREAGQVRFRPVLMTACSTILGMMPIALGYGAGGEARAPMGWSVAAGMFTATALTLVVIPVIYTLFAEAARWITDNALRALRSGILLALAAAGAWFLWLPYGAGIPSLFYLLAIPGLLLLATAIGLMTGRESARWVLVGLVGLFFAAGVLLVVNPTLGANLLSGLAPLRTGLGFLGIGLLCLAILLLPWLTGGRKSTA